MLFRSVFGVSNQTKKKEDVKHFAVKIYSKQDAHEMYCMMLANSYLSTTPKRFSPRIRAGYWSTYGFCRHVQEGLNLLYMDRGDGSMDQLVAELKLKFSSSIQSEAEAAAMALVSLLKALLELIAEMHSKQLTHNDLKPSNIIFMRVSCAGDSEIGIFNWFGEIGRAHV